MSKRYKQRRFARFKLVAGRVLHVGEAYEHREVPELMLRDWTVKDYRGRISVRTEIDYSHLFGVAIGKHPALERILND